MNKILKKNKGILFWITGLSGAGKSSLAKKIYFRIKKRYGPTIILHGDNFRKIFKLKGYSKNERLIVGKMYIKFLELIINQKINVIFSVIGLFDELRKINTKKFDNYVEIFIKTDLKKIFQYKKHIYKKNNVWGKNIEPEYPKKPNIIINNNFNKDLNNLGNLLFNKIKNFLK
jgi:adenylylsulfate kinase-like enzyme